MYASAPVASKVTTVLRDSPAGITTSVGRVGWRSSVAVRWTAWTASSPTIHVVDRVEIAQRDRHRHADGHRDLRRLEARVADHDLVVVVTGPRPPASAAPPAPSATMVATDAATARAAAGVSRANVRSVHRQAWGRRVADGDRRPSTTTSSSTPTARVAPSSRRTSSRLSSTIGPGPRGPPGPTMGRPGRSRRSRGHTTQQRRVGFDGHLREPAVGGNPAHARVGAEVVQEALGGVIAVVEAHAVRAGRGREERRRAVGEEVDVGLDDVAAGLAQGEDADRHPGFGVGIVMWTGVPSPIAWPRSAAALASKTAARKIGLRLA